MTHTPTTPYNDLPLLPPQGVTLETPSVLKKVISASRALAHLNGLGQSIPNQTMLINSVVLQEAKDSSEIENIVTTNDELYQAISADDLGLSPSVKEVVNYRKALWRGYLNLREGNNCITTNMFEELVQLINGHTEGIRKNPGTNIKNKLTSEIVYTPPVGERKIRELLENLEEFYESTELTLDPLVRLSVGHYQFEAIHPFGDGNGRTGRIVNILYLVHQGLLDMPILYLSRYIIEHKAEYYNLLRGVTERGEWENWILYMLTAIEQTAVYTAEKLRLIKQSMETTAERIRVEAPRVYSKDILEILFEQPYTRINRLVSKGIASRRTSSEYLHELVAIGLLSIIPVGRDKLFLNVDLYKILQDLEAKKPDQGQLSLPVVA